MQKVVKFLESYIQWLALSLGLLWVLWVGYAYWAQKPVSQDIKGTLYGPADVDEFVARPGGPIETLQTNLKADSRVPKDVIAYFPPVPQYVNELKDKMGAKSFLAQDIPAFSPGGGGVIVPVGPAEDPDKMKKVDAIALGPDIVKMLGVTSGLSVAYKPDPKVPVDPKDPQQKVIQLTDPAKPAVDPNKPVDPNQPQPANPLPANQITLVMTAQEISWQTVSATVQMTPLAAAFKNAGLPDAAAFTQFLRVRLVREELMPDGTWANNKVIDDLPIEAKLPWPPAPGGADEGAYLAWATANVPAIVQPPFYEVLRGALWHTISMPDPNLAAAAQVQPVEFDPATVTDVSKLTDPEQRKKYFAWKLKEQQAKDKADAEQRKASRPSKPTGPGASRNAPPSNAPPPMDDQRLAQNTNPGLSRDNSGYDRRARNSYPPRNFGESGTPPVAGAGATPSVVNGAEIPAAPFAPATAKDLEVWAHDDTTVPGHVYRYKISVYIKNPLFATLGNAKNPEDAKKLFLGAESAWSDNVESPRKQYFFATTGGDSIAGNNPKMKFEYFWWEDGDWKTKNLELRPGDAIGTTPWTLVDIRPYGGINENRAVLVSESGEIDSRFYKSDLNSADYKRLKGLIKPATATATP
jgi:hypothetical protein